MAYDLNALIAQGPPSVSFSPLSNLLGDYMAGRDLRAKFDTQNAFRDGVPMKDGQVDYSSMARRAFTNGDMLTGLKLGALANYQVRDRLRYGQAPTEGTANNDASAPSFPKFAIADVLALRQNRMSPAEFDEKYGGPYAVHLTGE